MSPSWARAALLTVALAAAAMGFTLLRQPEHRASLNVVAVEREVLRPAIGPGYLRARLFEGKGDLATRLERSGIDPGLLGGVRIRSSAPGGPVRISAAAGTPARAARLLRLVVLQIDALSARELAATARRRLREARAALASQGLSTAGRRALVARARGLRRYLRAPRSRFGASTVRVERPARWADQVVGSLPGPFPARPSLLLAGFGGTVVGAAVGGAVALLRRRWAS